MTGMINTAELAKLSLDPDYLELVLSILDEGENDLPLEDLPHVSGRPTSIYYQSI